MRRAALLVGVLGALIAAALLPSFAGAAFTQCPPVDFNKGGCQFLVTVTNGGTSVAEDPTAGGPYEGSDDALIGVQNNSSGPVTSIHLSAENSLFGFEEDGICNPGEGPMPRGCKALPEKPTFEGGKEKNLNAGKECGFEGELGFVGPTFTETACAFPEPAGEPAGVTFPAGVFIVGYGKNGNPVTGYEGPTSWFSGIGPLGEFPTGSGTINFSPAIPPGGSSYFSLESPPAGGFGAGTTVNTTLTGGGQAGPTLRVIQGTPVQDTATLGGLNATTATGTVSYNVYSDPACSKAVAAAGAGALSGGTAGASTAVTLPPGTYYWQASYGGDINNRPAASTCGGEVLTVLAPTATSTAQTGGGVTGASIPVLKGASVTDKATITGSLAKTATGTVTYTLFKDSKCTKPAAAQSIASVVGGVAGPSAAVKPALGVYYWVATYSGDALNAPSASACGSEVLTVAQAGNLGLSASSKKCLSKRHFPIHPRSPGSSPFAHYQEYINGTLVKQGSLSGHATSVNLIGLPKGTYKVQMVVITKNGKRYLDTRTFHTCVPKKKKGKKHK